MNMSDTEEKRNDEAEGQSQVGEASNGEERDAEEEQLPWVIRNISDSYGHSDGLRDHAEDDEPREYELISDAIRAAHDEIESVDSWGGDDGTWSRQEITAHYSYEISRTDGSEEYCGDYVVERDPDELAPGSDDCDHEWKGVGGIDSNPGVWGGPGTKITVNEECEGCRMERTTVYYGSQRNPGEEDYVKYSPAPELDEDEEEEEEQEDESEEEDEEYEP